jgi:diguanylate cyclase (GGDEF)-like protein
VLCIVAQRLKNQIREQQDLVCRFGGDEFAVLISCRKEQILVVEFIAQKILDTLSQPINLKQGTVVQVGASIGVSMNSDLDFDEQIAQADKAMYKVKKQGKNNYAFFEQGL